MFRKHPRSNSLSSLLRGTSTLALMVTITACAGADEVLVDEMVVVLIDAVDVPANENGVIAEIVVHEGDSVQSGQALARLDDRRVRLEESLAKTKLAIATEQADNSLAVELAEKKLAQQRQLAKQQEIARDVATRKSKNKVRILASQKARGCRQERTGSSNPSPSGIHRQCLAVGNRWATPGLRTDSTGNGAGGL